MGRELRREYGGFAAGWTGPIEALSSKARSERRAMSGTIEARLKELGIELPQPTAPLANYVPFTIAGNLVFIAGQISQWNGERRFVGKLGAGISIADGQQAARLCALNIIAHLRVAAGGDLDRVRRCLRLGGVCNRPPEVTRMPPMGHRAPPF